jgi:hypothetical protein
LLVVVLIIHPLSFASFVMAFQPIPRLYWLVVVVVCLDQFLVYPSGLFVTAFHPIPCLYQLVVVVGCLDWVLVYPSGMFVTAFHPIPAIQFPICNGGLLLS